MFKRDNNSSQLPIISDDQDHLQKKKYQKKKNIRCSIQSKDIVLKYSTPSQIYRICGDIFMMPLTQECFTDLFFMNEFKQCSSLFVKEDFNQKMVYIELSDRNNNLKESMNDLLVYLENNPVGTDWYGILKNYSLTYSKVITKQSRKKSKSDLRKKYFAKVNQETNYTKESLFRSYPSILSKYRTRNHQTQLCEIVISEFFINELGYEMDDFISYVLQEGFPPIMSYENGGNSCYLKAMIEKFFKFQGQGLAFQGLQSKLITKDGDVKDIIYQSNALMNYEAKTFGFDMIISLTHKGKLYFDENLQQNHKINENFVKMMAKREEERNDFLSDYYNIKLSTKWTNFDMTCTVKKLQESQIEEDGSNYKIEEEEF